MDVTTQRVAVWWDTALTTTTTVSLVLGCIAGLAWICLTLVGGKKKEGK